MQADLHKLATEELANLADVNLTQHFASDQNRLGEIYNLALNQLFNRREKLKEFSIDCILSNRLPEASGIFRLIGLETLAISALNI
jgi:hypothetical protein